MCLCPIRIKNNCLDYCKGRDAEFYYVPCGKCYECRNAKKADYTFRCISEMLTTDSQVYYYTLTFNDDNLPLVIVDSKENPNKDIKFNCFSKSLVVKFVKRLRKCLDKKYHIKLRYLITSEFGEKFKRPHHHALFFLSGGKIPPTDFRKLIARFWASPLSKEDEKLLKDNPKDFEKIMSKYSYGFNKPGKYGGLVSNFLPLEYVCKYVAKDLSFYDALPINLEDYKKEVWEFPEFNEIRTFPFREFKNECLPFTLMSSNFGEKIIDKFTFDNLVSSTYDVIDHLGRVHSYKIPLYYKRKILYIRGLNENGNMHYMLNKLGYDVLKCQLKKQIQDDMNFITKIPDILRRYTARTIGLHAFNFPELGYTQYALEQIFSKMDVDERRLISEYKNFYRNKLCCDWSLDFDNDFDIYKIMQTKLRKAPFLFEKSTIFEDCLDVITLEHLTMVIDVVQKFLAKEKAKDHIHREKTFKTLYYGQEYIEESEVEILSL